MSGRYSCPMSCRDCKKKEEGGGGADFLSLATPEHVGPRPRRGARPAAEVCLLGPLASSALSAIGLPLLLLQPHYTGLFMLH